MFAKRRTGRVFVYYYENGLRKSLPRFQVSGAMLESRFQILIGCWAIRLLGCFAGANALVLSLDLRMRFATEY
jgi:hypothetical protein